MLWFWFCSVVYHIYENVLDVECEYCCSLLQSDLNDEVEEKIVVNRLIKRAQAIHYFFIGFAKKRPI